MLERYRYMIAAAGIALLLLPRVPGSAQSQRRLPRRRASARSSFQPAEFAKIAIIIFLASYLRDTRQLLVTGGRRSSASRSRRSSTSARCWSSGASRW